MKLYRLILTIVLISGLTTVYSQVDIETITGKYENVNPKPLSYSELEKVSSIQLLKLPQSYKNSLVNGLPDSLDNSQLPFWRPVFNQVALECGQASGIGEAFTYEINYERGLPGNLTDNQYPTHFAWNFTNSGYSHGVSFFDTWEVLRSFGTPNVTTYGGMYIPGGGARIWVDGYNYYYEGMKNRIDGVYAIDVSTEEGILTLKHWLDNHLENADFGGVANYYASVPSVVPLPAGTPNAGKPVVLQWGGANHGMTICGYNDSIRYDINGDGQYTNNIDINGDGIVNVKDWEKGALRFANNYGGGPNWGDNGFAYMMYRTLVLPYGQGGIWSQKVYVLKTRENVDPVLTMKINLRHTSREKLKVYAGVATDTAATEPQFTKDFSVFNYQGGDYYMKGGTTEPDKELEFGLDISDLLNYVDSGEPAKFFLLIDENDPTSAATGDMMTFSLINYTISGAETFCLQSNIPLINDGLSSFSIITSVNFPSPEIVTDSLSPAIVNDPYSCQIDASGGTPPYFWELNKDYKETISSNIYPEINTTAIVPNTYYNGTATVSLNFDFPFFGTNFSQVVVSTDGYLLLNENLPGWPYQISSELFALTKKRIAPFEGDLTYTTSLGQGLWFEGNSSWAHFRWKGYFSGQSNTNTVDFGVRLYSDGNIEVYYNDMLIPAGSEWLSAIYSGNPNQIQKLAVNNMSSITAGTKLNLTVPFLPDGLFITSDGIVKGTPTELTAPTPIRIKCIDAANMITKKDIFYLTTGINSLIVQNVTILSGGNQFVEPGETAAISLEVRNVITDDINNSTMVVTSTNPEVQMIDSTEYLGNIDAGDTLVLNNSFTFTLVQAVANLTELSFQTIIYSALDTFISHFEIPALGPNIQVMGITVFDNGNGYLEPGESATLHVAIKNTGNTAATNVSAVFSTSDPYLMILNPNASVPAINPGQTVNANINVYVSSLAGILTSLTSTFAANWGYTCTDTRYINLIFLGDDFESGDLSQLDWSLWGDDDWYADDTTVYEGQYSARSGYITHDEESNLTVEINVGAEGALGFYKKVSAEPNYDFLRFYINGVEMDKWDGNDDWSHITFNLDEGVKVLTWSYTKDYSINWGLDGAWIDYVTFPVLQELFVSVDQPEINDKVNNFSAYPNPFYLASVIEFGIESNETITLQIFDINGRLVRTLILSELYSPGVHTILWDGKNNEGETLPQGIYIAKIASALNNNSIRLVKIK